MTYTTETIAEMLPAEDWRIAGYGGEHDEAGASIRTDKGERVCSTASVSWQASPELWQAYYRRAAFIAAAPAIVRQLLAERDSLERQRNEALDQCAKLHERHAGVLELVRKKADAYQAGIGPELSDECKRELKWQAVALRELEKEIGELG